VRPRFIALAALPVLMMSAPLAAQPWAHLPHQTVTSHIGMMNELQKRGPNAYVEGPFAGGQYVVVGPLAGPPQPPRQHRRARTHRSHRGR
jgi:hypothetical protein